MCTRHKSCCRGGRSGQGKHGPTPIKRAALRRGQGGTVSQSKQAKVRLRGTTGTRNVTGQRKKNSGNTVNDAVRVRRQPDLIGPWSNINSGSPVFNGWTIGSRERREGWTRRVLNGLRLVKVTHKKRNSAHRSASVFEEQSQRGTEERDKRLRGQKRK